jgi:signal recognition particle GTPase
MRDQPWKQIVDGILPNIAYTEKAEKGPPIEQKIMIISGLGGCGKTQLVTKFAHEYRDK